MDDDCPVIIIEAGEADWLCGYEYDSGPAVVLPGIAADDVEAWRAQLNSAFEELEAMPSEHAIILSESPGTLPAQRERIVDILFNDFGVVAVHVAAAPLLALYNTGFDTGVLVDVGTSCACVLLIYFGVAVLDAATLHQLLPEGEDNIEGVREAILATISLADMSLRQALLMNITLVGSGSTAPDFPERLEGALTNALGGSAWDTKVRANADRRLACWLGGAVMASMPSARARFVTAEEYSSDADCLHEQSASLRCQTLEVQRETERAAAEAQAAARCVELQQSLEEAQGAAAEAALWWTAQAPPSSVAEEQRLRSLQPLVPEFFELALTLMGMDLAPLAQRNDDSTSKPTQMPVWTALAFAASALKLLEGAELHFHRIDNEDERLRWRLRHLLFASWSSSSMNTCRCADAKLALHLPKRAKVSALRALRADVSRRASAAARLNEADASWRRHAGLRALRKLNRWATDEEECAMRLEDATDAVGFERLRLGWAAWRRRSARVADAAVLLRREQLGFALRRGLGTWRAAVVWLRHWKAVAARGSAEGVRSAYALGLYALATLASTRRQEDERVARGVLNRMHASVSLRFRVWSAGVRALARARARLTHRVLARSAGLWMEWRNERACAAELQASAATRARAACLSKVWDRLVSERQKGDDAQRRRIQREALSMRYMREQQQRVLSRAVALWCKRRAERTAWRAGDARSKRLVLGFLRKCALTAIALRPLWKRCRMGLLLRRVWQLLRALRRLAANRVRVRLRRQHASQSEPGLRFYQNRWLSSSVEKWAKYALQQRVERSISTTAEAGLRLRRVRGLDHALGMMEENAGRERLLYQMELKLRVAAPKMRKLRRASLQAMVLGSLQVLHRASVAARATRAQDVVLEERVRVFQGRLEAGLQDKVIQACTHWRVEARRRLLRQLQLRKELWRLDELRHLLDKTNESHPGNSVKQLLKSGVEVGAIEVLDTRFAVPRALRIMRKGIERKRASVQHRLEKLSPQTALSHSRISCAQENTYPFS